MQELVKANGFIKGFSSIAADTNADQALLYTGKAAMMLHGGWVYGGMKAAQPEFVASGLGFGQLPDCARRQGRPEEHRGQPGELLLHLAKATDEEKTVAKAYFTDGLFTDAEVDAFIDSGQVPVSQGGGVEAGQFSRCNVPAVRLQHDESGAQLPAVLGPGAQPGAGRGTAQQHRPAVPAEDHARSSSPRR